MDLRGKKIATSRNSSAHFYIVKTLQSVGLSESDAVVVGMANSNCCFTAARMAAVGVRRDKAALFQWVQAPPGECSSRKQSGAVMEVTK